MASKRVKLCFDVFPIRSKDGIRHWPTGVSFGAPQRRHLTVEASSPATLEGADVLPSQLQSPPAQASTLITTAFPVISSVPEHIQQSRVTTTLHHFPTLEPLSFINYPRNHLSLPLRKDLLHRAIVYEGDMTRQGTAATKHRFEIHGSNRKLRPQKGSGKARLGDRSNPMLRGGGRAFDKKARDFSTGLPKKVYDIAWRTALSYRYARGELLVVDSLAVKEGDKFVDNVRMAQSWIEQVFPRIGWMKKGGGSLLLAAPSKDEETMTKKTALFEGLKESRGWGVGMTVDDVDVKDLLKGTRVVVEKQALDWMLSRHRSDLVGKSWEEPR